MANRLTDKRKKKIVADYLELGSYNATAKLNGTSSRTVKRVLAEVPEMPEKVKQKKAENTADILAYMERQRGLVCEIIGKGLNILNDEEKLIALKAMVGGSDTDDVLSTYLKLAGRKIIARAYPYDPSITEVPVQYDTLQCEIAAYMLNKRGAEGQTSHSENGISRSYENADIPASMIRVVTPHVGVIK